MLLEPPLSEWKLATLTLSDISFYTCEREADIIDGMKCVMIQNTPVLTSVYPDIEKLVLNRCDKNFIYHKIRRKYFPNVQEMWLFSHPCGGGGGFRLLRDIIRPGFKLHIHEGFKKYFRGYNYYEQYRGCIDLFTQEMTETFLNAIQKPN